MSTNGIFCPWRHAVFMQSCLALMSNNNYRLINASTDSSSVRYTNTKSTSDQYPSSMFKSVYNQPAFTQCSSKPQDNISVVPHRQYLVDNALTFLFSVARGWLHVSKMHFHGRELCRFCKNIFFRKPGISALQYTQQLDIKTQTPSLYTNHHQQHSSSTTTTTKIIIRF